MGQKRHAADRPKCSLLLLMCSPWLAASHRKRNLDPNHNHNRRLNHRSNLKHSIAAASSATPTRLTC